MNAVCVRCARDKELPLGRCAGCGWVPTGEDRVASVLLSTRVLSVPELTEAQVRLSRGEPFKPSAARLASARRVLLGERSPTPASLTPLQMLGLGVGNLALTPALGLAVWFGLRDRPGPGARQALWLTLPISAALAALWLALALGLGVAAAPPR